MRGEARDLETYRDLLVAFEPRLIRSEKEAEKMGDLIDIPTDLPRLSEGQREVAELLGQLLYDWETEREEPIEVSPQEIVESLLEDDGLSQVDLAGPVFSSRSTASDFLAGRRPVSYERVGRLTAFFHLSPAVFYPIRGALLPKLLSGEQRFRQAGSVLQEAI